MSLLVVVLGGDGADDAARRAIDLRVLPDGCMDIVVANDAGALAGATPHALLG